MPSCHRDSTLLSHATLVPSLWVALLLAGCAHIDPGPAPLESAESHVVRHNLVYAERADGALLADVYRPRLGRHPGVVVVHPGGWVSGEKADVARVAAQLADAGYVAVAASYRLAPDHVFPAQLHDLKEVVRWMRANSDELGLDPERIAAFGYSAGGHLAALLATSDADDGLEGDTAFPGISSRVQALVAGGTPSDLQEMPGFAVSSLLGGSASKRPQRAADASPIHLVTSDDPPAFLYHGRLDLFVSTSHARRLFAAFQREGVPSKLSFNRLGHFSTFMFGHTQEAFAIAFLDRWIGRDAETRLAADADAETEPQS